MPAYIWLFLGLALLAAEMMAPSFFLMFFGISALIVAGTRVIGLDNITAEIALFAVLGIGLVLLLRKRMQSSGDAQPVLPDVGQTIKLEIDLMPGEEGTVSYQGAPWTAVNGGTSMLQKGDHVRVKSTSGIRLIIEKE